MFLEEPNEPGRAIGPLFSDVDPSGQSIPVELEAVRAQHPPNDSSNVHEATHALGVDVAEVVVPCEGRLKLFGSDHHPWSLVA